MPIYEHCLGEQCSLLYPSYFKLHVRWLLWLTPVNLSQLPGHVLAAFSSIRMFPSYRFLY